MTETHRERSASPQGSPRPNPNKRTRSDNVRSGAADASGDASPSSSSAHIPEMFCLFRDEIDAHNDRRERLIKSSRDVTALSKKVIFLLHRFDITDFASAQPTVKTRKLFSEAETKLQEIISLLRQSALAEGLGSIDAPDAQLDASTKRLRSHRYERNLGGGLEEFIEAISFYHYLRTTQLITIRQIQDRFLAEPIAESHFYPEQAAEPSEPTSALPASDSQSDRALHVPAHRYLLGLSDLTGELMRFATNAVGQGDTGHVVKQVLALTRQLRDALDPFVPLIRDLKKKQSVTNQSLRKIEDILYAITVRSAEFGSDPQALREMVRRTLASSSAPNPHDDDQN
ncbi:hypothetical protein EX895_003635 [Sporisorium graminicola]|uniref:Translin n=1 Tax=Sporisorium graminicola TaxID=280036 RepID=A0A4U7KUF6_9BASI|nr:hypothetical protein EX895_003635 [Sporisorium graminicola]TKY86958.1 hypothetical protein EX895_003635 [Sporisorium graminicola]